MVQKDDGGQNSGVMPGRDRPAIDLGLSVSPQETWRAGQFQDYYTIGTAICKHRDSPEVSEIISEIISEISRRRRFPA